MEKLIVELFLLTLDSDMLIVLPPVLVTDDLPNLDDVVDDGA